MTGTTEVTTVTVACEVGQWLFDTMCSNWPTISAGTDSYRLAYDEELPEGDPARHNPDALILRRERDGALFDLGIDVFISLQPDDSAEDDGGR